MVQEQHTSLRNCIWNLPNFGTLSQGAACTFSVLCVWAAVPCRQCVVCISHNVLIVCYLNPGLTGCDLMNRIKAK